MTTIDLTDWHDASAAERAALEPPPRIAASVWCERYLWLAGASVARPGPFSFGEGRAYMREPIDDASDPTCRRSYLMTSTQVGKTTIQMARMAYRFVCKAGPQMFVAPRDLDLGYMLKRRLHPIMQATDALRRLLTKSPRDYKKSEIALRNGALLYTGTGRSAASVKSKPVPDIELDEVDAYPLVVSKDEGASAIMLAEERTNEWLGRELIGLCSTPTTEGGAINQAMLASDWRRYWVPCPSCGWWQMLRFDQLKIPKAGEPHYECEGCAHHITDREKREAVDLGKWVQRAATIDQATGEVSGAYHSAIRGRHLPCFYAPRMTWQKIADKWRLTQEDPTNRLQHWTNSWLAEPFKDRAQTIHGSDVKTVSGGYRRNVIPEGCYVLTSGADTQQAGFHYVVRGWGFDGKSWLIDEGYVSAWNLLLQQTIWRRWEGCTLDGLKTKLRVSKMLMDSRGGREAEVHGAARQYGFSACKGLESMTIPYRESVLRKSRIPGLQGQPVVWVHTNYYKRTVFAEMARGQWRVFDDIPEEYVSSIASEELVRVRAGTGFKERYEKKHAGIRNDKLDCEVYARCAADMIDVSSLVADGIAMGAGPEPDPDDGAEDGKPGECVDPFMDDRDKDDQEDDWVTRRRR